MTGYPKRIIMQGWLRTVEDGEGTVLALIDECDKCHRGDPLIVSKHLSEVLEYVGGYTGTKLYNATVRIHSANKQFSLEDGEEWLIQTAMGAIKQNEYEHAYSDLTGYLWTDEKFVVGDHDLASILYGLIGGKYAYPKKPDKYVILDIEVHRIAT